MSKVLLLGISLCLMTQAAWANQLTASLYKDKVYKNQRLVSVHFVKQPLADALHELAQKADAGISYKTESIPPKLVTYKARKESIFKVLDAILSDTGLYATLSENRKVILIKKQVIQTTVQQETITGTVTDASTGQSLPGVNIRVEETTQGAYTGGKGHYKLSVDNLQGTLIFSFVGYDTKKVSIDGRTKINVALQPSTKGLDELIVTATGTTSSRKIGTSVSKINSADFNPTTVANTQSILIGNVNGATVLANSGQPGTGATIRLRGNNSISQSNDPIVYLDGIRINSGSTGYNSEAGQSPSALNDINPNDIANISVVKGPAATTLYGTEASGGVIRITTKQGISGETVWNASATAGFNNIGHFGPSEDNPTGLFLGKCRGDGLQSYDGTLFEDANCPESGSWLRNGLVQRYNLSVSSGIENFTYFISGNFQDEQGVIYDGGENKNYGLRGNFKFNPVDNVSVRFSSSINRGTIKWVPQGNNGDGFILNVTRGPGGNFSGASGCEDADVTCVDNGQILNKIDDNTVRYHYINSLVFNVKSGNRLENRITLGADLNNQKDRDTQFFGYSRNPGGEQRVNNYQSSEFSVEYLGTYKLPVSQTLQTTFNWGGQFFRDKYEQEELFSEDFSGPQDPTLTSGARTEVVDNDITKTVKGGIFGQASFDIYDQLYVTAGVRVDGHSSFGENFGWQVYPKISASYVLSDYDFWPASWWDNFRVRAAIGESGQAPGPFDAVRTWSPIAGDDGQPGFTPNDIGNADLGPEISRELEMGFDASFIDSRVDINFTYYNQKTRDALIPVPGVPSQGFTSTQLRNIGEIENSGIEANIDLSVLRLPNLNWNVKAGYSKDKSKVLDLGDLDNITVEYFGRTYIREGYALPGVFGAKVTNPDEIADPVYEEDHYYGPSYPDKNISLGTSLRLWKSLTVDAKGVASLGGYMVNGDAYQTSRRGVWPPCYAAQQQDASTLTAAQRAKCALNSGSVDPRYDNWIESTDFFKLRNLSVRYDMPQKWLPQGLSSTSITLSARNLFTITNYSGTDPEIDEYTGSLARRDYYVMPTYRTFLATINFSF